MKKSKQQTEKKLSLKKLQLMKINNMKVIKGGYGFDGGFNVNDGNDDPGVPTLFRTQSGK